MVITAPSTFRVIALISTYNEEDIIVPVIKHLIKEGISVYIIDNWSTDRTWELLNELSPSLFGLERFPKDGPSPTFDWEDILKRKEELSKTLDADWFIHHDADEIRESPWPGVTLKDAIYLVDLQGYNALDFILLNFYPIDNSFKFGMDPIEHFEYFNFSEIAGNLLQIKAWKRLLKPDMVKLVYGGHLAEFANRKIYPFKFLLRHYPIRSQHHGEIKVIAERIGRYNRTEKEKGWHTQYENIDGSYNFIKDPSTLIRFHVGIYLDLMMKQMLELAQATQQISTDLKERDYILQNLNNELVDRKQSIQQLTSQLAERDQSIQQLTSQLAERDQSIQKLTTELTISEQEVLFYSLSKSWRITRPLRKIIKLAKRFFRKEK